MELPSTALSALIPALVPKNVPSKFIAIVCLKSSRLRSSIGIGIETPAELITLVKPSICFWARSMASSQLWAEVTSSSTKDNSSPYCAAKAWPFSTLISPMTTCAPSLIKCRAVAAPIPLAPPDMIAFLPLNRPIIVSYFCILIIDMSLIFLTQTPTGSTSPFTNSTVNLKISQCA